LRGGGRTHVFLLLVARVLLDLHGTQSVYGWVLRFLPHLRTVMIVFAYQRPHDPVWSLPALLLVLLYFAHR